MALEAMQGIKDKTGLALAQTSTALLQHQLEGSSLHKLRKETLISESTIFVNITTSFSSNIHVKQ